MGAPQQLLAAGGGTIAVSQFEGQLIYENSTSLARFDVTFETDGTVSVVPQDAFGIWVGTSCPDGDSSGEIYSISTPGGRYVEGAPITGVGSGFWVRFTEDADVDNNTTMLGGLSFGTWYQLSVARALRQDDGAIDTWETLSQVTVDISRSDGGAIVATGVITLNAGFIT